MIRMLMAGTAFTAVLVGSAFAQSSSTLDSSAVDMAVSSQQMTDASSMESSMLSTDTSASSAPFSITTGYTRVDTDRLATKIIGSPVYDGTGTDANNLGKINDLVLNENGDIAAVVVGVGGFLGLGEKQVAVDYSSLQWTTAADNTERFVLATTKDELTAAPDFQTVDDQPSSAVDVTSSSSAM